jgi:hypothetical protein
VIPFSSLLRPAAAMAGPRWMFAGLHSPRIPGIALGAGSSKHDRCSYICSYKRWWWSLAETAGDREDIQEAAHSADLEQRYFK